MAKTIQDDICQGAKKKGSWCVTGKLNFFLAMAGSTSILFATQTTGMSGPDLKKIETTVETQRELAPHLALSYLS